MLLGGRRLTAQLGEPGLGSRRQRSLIDLLEREFVRRAQANDRLQASLILLEQRQGILGERKRPPIIWDTRPCATRACWNAMGSRLPTSPSKMAICCRISSSILELQKGTRG